MHFQLLVENEIDEFIDNLRTDLDILLEVYGSYDLDDIANGTIDDRAASLEQEMLYEDQENLLIQKLLDSGYTAINTLEGNMYISPRGILSAINFVCVGSIKSFSPAVINAGH